MISRALFMLSCALAAGSAIASDVSSSASSSNEPIIIEGTADVQKQIDRFIKNLTPAPIHGQVGRFEGEVCPIAVGLAPGQDTVIADRMRRVARAAGIPVADGECHPNVILMVTNSKAALIERLLRERPYMFPDSWSIPRIHELERDPAPAAAWAIENVATADGMPVNYSFEAPINRTTRADSRLVPSARPYFTASVVIVQVSALSGLTTIQLADYAAMRGFASTDPARLDAGTPTSILTLLDTPMGQSVPVTLTAWDLSFPKSFYATRRNAYIEYQRAQMKELMKRDLAQQQRP